MDHESAVVRALEAMLGPSIVLDAQLRVVGWTDEARALVGGLQQGALIVHVLCGDADRRPLAEALAEGRSVSARVPRPTAEDPTRELFVRAWPIHSGYMLVLGDAEAEVREGLLTRWGMVTAASSMMRLFDEIERVARRDTTVLVRGESGTGKELVARAIHEASPRQGGPFRAINCAALPPHLLESELFGHVRGAFTGAVKDAPGHFRIAHGGTLFLDEVADLPLELQGKLLRVLQEKSVVPVGGRSPIEVDVRIISATHTSLRQAVRQGRFREDLMYRLRVIPLFLPPLRERDGDIEVLAKHVLSNFADEHREVMAISSDALSLLEEHDWPGNVRELANVMEYAFAMGDGPVLTAAQLPPELNGTERVPVPNVPPEITGETLSVEQVALLRALERASGHRGRAAASLGISRSTLWRRLKEIESLSEASAEPAPTKTGEDA